MIDRLASLFTDEKNRNVFYTATGLVALLAGRKLPALALFGKGLGGLEKAWREAHPEFSGGLSERWEAALAHYEATHTNSTNRKLHIVGIPFIVAGSAGLLLFSPYRPLWGFAALSFVGGWALNFIGHGMFEKNAPAFSDDPLSFVAGPVWDFRQLLSRRRRNDDETPITPRGNGHPRATA